MVRPFLVALFVTLAACSANPEPRQVVITCLEGGDAGAPEPFESDTSPEAVGGVTTCARACRNLSKLGCPEAWKLPGGRTCTETCKKILPISSYDPICVENAKNIDEVRKCPQITCK